MEKKIMIVLSMILLIVSANMETVNSDAFDCFDSCITGCVNSNNRLQIRCERKCRIRCDPGMVMEGATLVVVRPVGGRRETEDHREDEGLAAEAFGKEGGVYAEAVERLLKSRNYILEMNSF